MDVADRSVVTHSLLLNRCRSNMAEVYIILLTWKWEHDVVYKQVMRSIEYELLINCKITYLWMKYDQNWRTRFRKTYTMIRQCKTSAEVVKQKWVFFILFHSISFSLVAFLTVSHQVFLAQSRVFFPGRLISNTFCTSLSLPSHLRSSSLYLFFYFYLFFTCCLTKFIS